MAKQTLKKALYLVRSGQNRHLAQAASVLSGCPVQPCGETDQAWRQVTDLLPPRSQREYTVDDFVDAVYLVSEANRYRTTLSTLAANLDSAGERSTGHRVRLLQACRAALRGESDLLQVFADDELEHRISATEARRVAGEILAQY